MNVYLRLCSDNASWSGQENWDGFPIGNTERTHLRIRWWGRVRNLLLRPGWIKLPLVLLVICIGGAIPAPVLALFFGWILDIHWERIFSDPKALYPFACLDGACGSLCIYIFCLLPLENVCSRMQQYPKLFTYAAASGLALLGSTAGTWLANSGIRNLLGGKAVLITPPPLSRLIALSLMVSIGATLLVAFVRVVIAEAEASERALSEAAALAQAHALQSQINPHFFFNTLTTISVLAELDGKAANELLGQLAQLFRYTLSCSQSGLVTVEQELAFVANYLLIEQARFRRRLRFEMPPTGAGSDIYLPGLTLQPLVENAVRHGIAKRREGGLIKIRLDRTESTCTLSVANQVALSEGLPTLNMQDFFRPGHSLSNTRDRLSLVFRNQASLEVVSDGTDWIRTIVRLPIQRESS